MSIRIQKINIHIFIVIIFYLISVPYTFADQNHYNNIFVGERATGLGGAYTAISDDPAGLYYNPAGITYSSGSNLSASMNAFYSEKKHYDKVLGNAGWNRASSTLLPNFFGVTQPLSIGKIGFSYAVTDATLEDQDQAFIHLNNDNDKYVINFNNEDHTYNLGPSYAVKISKLFSLGTTLYLHYQKNQWILNQLYTFEDPNLDNYYKEYEWLNDYYELREIGIRPIIGFMWSPEEIKYSLGLTISRTYIFDSKIESLSIDKQMINNDENMIIRREIKSDEKREYPLQLKLGVAYFQSPSLLFSGDITYYSKTDDEVLDERRSFVNASFGTEYYLSNAFALRAGIFTNLTNTNSIKDEESGQPEHVDMYGGGLSLSYFTKYSSITSGIIYKQGKGEAQILPGTSIQNLTFASLMLYLGTSYSF